MLFWGNAPVSHRPAPTDFTSRHDAWRRYAWRRSTTSRLRRLFRAFRCLGKGSPCFRWDYLCGSGAAATALRLSFPLYLIGYSHRKFQQLHFSFIHLFPTRPSYYFTQFKFTFLSISPLCFKALMPGGGRIISDSQCGKCRRVRPVGGVLTFTSYSHCSFTLELSGATMTFGLRRWTAPCFLFRRLFHFLGFSVVFVIPSPSRGELHAWACVQARFHLGFSSAGCLSVEFPTVPIGYCFPNLPWQDAHFLFLNVTALFFQIPHNTG